jgi:hypothetical protein
MGTEAEQLALGEQGGQLGEWPLRTQATAQSPSRDTGSSVNAPRFHTLLCGQ